MRPWQAGSRRSASPAQIGTLRWHPCCSETARNNAVANEEGPSAKGSETGHSLKQLTQVVYALQAASFIIGFSMIAAVIVNYVKREDVAGTLYESHFRWQIRTFWFALLWGAIGALLALVIVGF